MAEIADLFSAVMQDIPGGQLKALRTISQSVRGPILQAGEVVELAEQNLDFRTAFEGPWTCQILSVTFVRDENGREVADMSPRSLMIGWILGGRIHPLFQEDNYTVWSWSNDSHWDLGPGDQIFVRASGIGRAIVAVRGVEA